MKDLRTGWPEEVLTGHYWLRTTGRTRSRVRRAAREFTADVHRLKPQPQLVWDVRGAADGGLDPRLVLACALLEYARLSDK